MVPEVNMWAVLLATVASMAIGATWYARPVFGRYWMKGVGLDEESAKSGSAFPLIVSIVMSFITAWVLAGAAAIAQHFYQGSFLVNSLLTALILWAGFTAARMITHDSFARRPWGLIALNLAHELVTLMGMGLVIGLFGISAS